MHEQIFKYHVVIPQPRRFGATYPADVPVEDGETHLVTKTTGLELVRPKRSYIIVHKWDSKVSAIHGEEAIITLISNIAVFKNYLV